MPVRILRWLYRWWPLMHGRGWILRLARLLVGSKAVRFEVGRGAVIEGALDDYVVIWAFMRSHQRDAAFQHSLDLLGPGSVAFDVGANIGIWTLLAAGRGARVHAFEPVPELVERLRAHVALNGADNVLVNSFAAGAESGSLPFFAVRKDNRGASGFARPSAPSEEIRVPVETLDAYVARRGITRVDVMKVDVEGAELLVFRGARALLSSPSAPALFFEVGEVLCARNGTTPRQLKQFLVDCGYRIYRWQRGAFAAVTVEERHDHEDLFALKTS